MSNEAKSTSIKEGGKPSLTPKLRFPEFQEIGGWDVVPLSELIDSLDAGVSVNSGGKPATDDEIGVLKTSAVTNGIFDPQENKAVLDESEMGRVKEPVRVDTIIISRMNTPLLVGANAYVETDMENIFLPDRLWAAKPKPGTSMRFVACILGSANGRAALSKLAKCSSGSMKNITKSEVLAFSIMVSSPAEQKKIAECLSSVDELIAAQARKVDALKTHKKGLMQQFFPREGETQPRLRFPEFRNSGEWGMGELGSLSDVRDGTHDSPVFYPKGRPLVTSKNLRLDGTLDLENVSLISEEDYEQIKKRSKVTVGDILFGMIGTIGNPVLIKSDGFAIKNVALIKELGPLSNTFIVQLLQSEYVAAIFAALNTGNSQKFIALGKIRKLPVPVPSLSEQKRIADCLISLDARITAETQKHEALKTHKKGLMQQLFPSPEEVEA